MLLIRGVKSYFPSKLSISSSFLKESSTYSLSNKTSFIKELHFFPQQKQISFPSIFSFSQHLKANVFRKSKLEKPIFFSFGSKYSSHLISSSNQSLSSNSRNFANKPIVQINDLSKEFQIDEYLFSELSLSLFVGQKIGILGPNGSGKSTLLKIIAGKDSDYSGKLKIASGVRVGYLEQEPILDSTKTVRELIFDGIPTEKRKLIESYNSLYPLYTQETDPIKKKQLEEQFVPVRTQMIEQKLMDIEKRIDIALQALRCPPSSSSITNLSGGEKRRVALCRLLISGPDLLLLDEPTNHLDTRSVLWLENFLQNFNGTVIAITHDRHFLDNVTDLILEIDRSKVYSYKGNYSDYLLNKQKRILQEERQDSNSKKLLAKEIEFLKTKKKGNKPKNTSKLEEYNQKLEALKNKKKFSPGTIVIPPGPRLGNVVIEANDLTKSFGQKVLFRNFSFKIEPSSIVGIIGPNGCGKTTLFNIISGNERPDRGDVRLGQTVKLAYVSQTRSQQLDPDKTVFEEISEGEEIIRVGEVSVNPRVYLNAFNFKGESQNKYVSFLSGGERNRLQLAKVLRRGPNLILLDEPTNDLDVEVLQNLEEALDEFAGSALIISHDRWFLDKLCSHIISFEGNGKAIFFPGNLTEYERIHGKKQEFENFRNIKTI